MTLDEWTDKYADSLRANVAVEMEQKGLSGPQLDEAVRHMNTTRKSDN